MILGVCAYEGDLGGGKLQIPDSTGPNSIEDKQGAVNSEPLPGLLSFLLPLSGREICNESWTVSQGPNDLVEEQWEESRRCLWVGRDEAGRRDSRGRERGQGQENSKL